MITPSFGLTATERVLPKLELDFTTASLDSRITFARALNTATRINASGNVEVVNADTARFDYDPATLVCKGLLIEESRINSIRNNTMVGASVSPYSPPTNWSVPAVAGLTQSVTEIGVENGIDYVDIRFVGTATGAQFIAFETTTQIVAAINETWSLSFYCKLVNGSLANVVHLKPRFTERTAAGTSVATGTGNAFTPTSNSLISQQQSFVRTLTGATTERLQPGIEYSVAGAVDFTIRVGLPQCEKGAFPTSVIKTSTAAVTRNADVATMTGTNFSSWFNPVEGAFGFKYAMVGVKSTASQRIMQVDDGTDTSRIANFLTSVNGVQMLITNPSGINGSISPATVTAVPNVYLNQALAYKLNNSQGAVNASTSGVDTTVDIPTVNTLRIAQAPTGVVSSCLWIANLYYWPQRLISAELAAFSK